MSDECLDGDCDACDGSGVRCPADPHCRLEVPPGWTIVERCDLCCWYADDLTAARALFHQARWITCAAGDHHAIGATPRDVANEPRGEPGRRNAMQSAGRFGVR